MGEKLGVDTPELRLIAQLAGIAPSRLAAALNNPEHLYQHLTLDELKRFEESCIRLSGVQARMIEALSAAAAAIRGAAN